MSNDNQHNKPKEAIVSRWIADIVDVRTKPEDRWLALSNLEEQDPEIAGKKAIDAIFYLAEAEKVRRDMLRYLRDVEGYATDPRRDPTRYELVRDEVSAICAEAVDDWNRLFDGR